MIVHSKPNHFQHRKVIRSTWGSLRHFIDLKEKQDWATRLIFVLGQVDEDEEIQRNGTRFKVRDLVEEESDQQKDIVVGSFYDNYHNLRYKHVLGLRYAARHCSHAVFFLKADDDAFIDLPGLYYYLLRTFGPLNNQIRDILAGNVFPNGTVPQRKGKWAVDISEYPWCKYPSYLGGLAYLITPDVARDLYRIAHTSLIPEIWVDDVWVTGLLAHTLRIHPLYLNPHYSYEHDEMKEWLEAAQAGIQPPQHPPYTFAHLDQTRRDWQDFSQNLWKEVRTYYTTIVDQSYMKRGERQHFNFIHEVVR